MTVEIDSYTNYQIDRAQMLKRCADSYEMTKSLLELNKEELVKLEYKNDVGKGDIPVGVKIALIIDKRFNFGQFLVRKSLVEDMILESLGDDAQEIVEFAKQKFIIHNGEDTTGAA